MEPHPFKDPFIHPWHFIFLCLILLLSLPDASFAQTVRPSPSYEPENPFPLLQPDTDRWNYLAPGLHGSYGSTDMRYERDIVPLFTEQRSWSACAWRGEKVDLQLILWSSNGIRQVRCEPTEFKNEKGASIGPSSVQIRFVRYLISENEFTDCGRRDPLNQPVLHADILDDIGRFDIPERSTRPVWITIHVPRTAEAGDYKGRLIVRAEGGIALDFDLRLEVLPLVLSEPSEWVFHLDLWQNPWAIARYHDVKPWSAEHVALLKPLLRMLGDAGEKCITTTLISHPWNAQTYDAYESMVEWIRRADGTWYFDYTVFDRYVDLCHECGITRQINCYSMICFRTNTFKYFNESSGNYEYLYAEPGTEAYEAHWAPFLRDFVIHLKERGWLGKTCIAMDERPYELMSKIIGFLHETAPGLGIALASEDAEENLNAHITDYSVSLSRFTKKDILEERNRRGVKTTFYVCCVEEQPNTYPASEPAESAWIGWCVAANGFSGFLRWAYNSWGEYPLHDARYINWAPGENFLVYPGARSSIRFERLREGIQDHEKILTVKKILGKQKGSKAKKDLAELDKLLELFTYNYAQNVPCTPLVNEGKSLLEKISRSIAGME